MRARPQSSPKKVPRILPISDIILPFRGLGDRHPSACLRTRPTHWAYERHRYHAAAPPRAPAPRRCACALAPDTQVPDALQE